MHSLNLFLEMQAIALSAIGIADGIYLVAKHKWHRPWYWLARRIGITLRSGRSARICGAALILWGVTLLALVAGNLYGGEVGLFANLASVILTGFAVVLFGIGWATEGHSVDIRGS